MQSRRVWGDSRRLVYFPIPPLPLVCGLGEPGFETCLTERCVITRHECSKAHPRASVQRVWVSDDLARIPEFGQAPPHEFIQTKLFWASNFDGAVYRRAYCNPAHGTGDIVGGHRLEKHRWQTHFVAVGGNIGDGLEKFEELRCVDDGVGDWRFFDQLLLSDLGSEVTAFGQTLRSHDR